MTTSDNTGHNLYWLHICLDKLYIHSRGFSEDFVAAGTGVGRGGKRAGAGRPAGPAWKTGTRALRAEARAKLAEIVGSEHDPLTFVCQLANDIEQDMKLRLSAAEIALPFLHPRLSAMASVTARLPDGGDPKAAVATILEQLDRMRSPPVIEAFTAETRTQNGHDIAKVSEIG